MTGNKNTMLILTSEKNIPGGRIQEVIGLYVPFNSVAGARRIARRTEKAILNENHEDICLHRTRRVSRDEDGPQEQGGYQ